MSDHNKCPSSEKEDEKCIFRLSYFHRIEPKYEQKEVDGTKTSLGATHKQTCDCSNLDF